MRKLAAPPCTTLSRSEEREVGGGDSQHTTHSRRRSSLVERRMFHEHRGVARSGVLGGVCSSTSHPTPTTPLEKAQRHSREPSS